MCWHKWDKWSDPIAVPRVYYATTWSLPIHFYRDMQERSCTKCGKTQQRFVN